MKIVINKCFGGFGLSPLAVAELAKMDGRPCYFFKGGFSGRYEGPVTLKEIEKDGLFFNAFDIPNPNEALEREKDWFEMTAEERIAWNELYSKHNLNTRPEDRTCPKLIKVVEKLGKKANGRSASLSIVEIPDGVEWEIDEYDGSETIHEKHRSWG